ncbi:MAG: DUF4333 domain-containing protein [Solirubrobacterales bacterium]|nr:DUF4333 domain-containing protein [Solirubrobacterales bacterium]
MKSTERKRLSARWLALAAVVPVFALGACSSGSSSVPQADVEKTIASQVKAKYEGDVTVKCDGDLEGKVGAKQACTVTVDGKPVEGTAVIKTWDSSTNKGTFTWDSVDPAAATPGDTSSAEDTTAAEDTTSQ